MRPRWRRQRARGREAPPARGRCQPGSLERARERLEIVRGRVVDLDVALAQELLQLRQVAAVGGDGVARCAPLEREVREEVCDCIHAQHLRVPAPVPSRPVSTHAGGSRTGAVDAVIWLDGEPLSIRVSPGVHTPSPFTQALISALPRVDGLTVIDAGCGAGAVTVALLRRGAAHVSAWDIVPAAIEDTLENVSRHADPARVTPHLGSFDCIADVDADLLVTNPPQRPRSVWEQLPADARGVGAGGEDGLEKLELILASTRAPRVITSISTLTAPDLAPIARRHGFERASLLADDPGRARPDLALCRQSRGRAHPRLGIEPRVSDITHPPRAHARRAGHPRPDRALRERPHPAGQGARAAVRGRAGLLGRRRGRARRRLRRRPPAVGGHRRDPHRRRRSRRCAASGIGRSLVERLIATVRELGIERVFVLTFERDFFAAFGFREIEGTPVTAEVYAELRSSFDEGVAEFLDLERVKPNTLGNHRMLLELS